MIYKLNLFLPNSLSFIRAILIQPVQRFLSFNQSEGRTYSKFYQSEGSIYSELDQSEQRKWTNRSEAILLSFVFLE